MEGVPRESPSEELLAAIKQGDLTAWGKLIERYRPYLFAVATRTLGHRHSDDYSSVVQEGVVKATERFEQFRGETPAELLAWLARIVQNQALDRRRRASPRGALPTGSAGEELLAASGSTPSAQACRRERAARVLAAMERLPPDYREVIDLRFFQDLDHAEIATRMERTNDAVRCLCVRAVRRLREELGEEP